MTVGHAIESWLEGKRNNVRRDTFDAYTYQARYVSGPLADSETRKALIKRRTVKLTALRRFNYWDQ